MKINSSLSPASRISSFPGRCFQADLRPTKQPVEQSHRGFPASQSSPHRKEWTHSELASSAKREFPWFLKWNVVWIQEWLAQGSSNVSLSFLPSSGLTPLLDLKGGGNFRCDLSPSPEGSPLFMLLKSQEQFCLSLVA